MLSLTDIRRARERIRADIYESPLAASRSLSQMAGRDILVKLENLQMTGSFKERGALNLMRQLPRGERERGVVAASAGNHAQALAWIAQQMGIPALLVMPRNTPLVKVANTRQFGAEIVLHGTHFAEALEKARELEAAEGMTFVHPYDDPRIIAGQGTIGLELLEQAPDLDSVVVPVGGGGLCAGICVAIKAQNPRVQIVGVEVDAYATGKLSLQAHRLVECGGRSTLDDGIAVKSLGETPFRILNEYIDKMVTVSDEEIAGAILTLLEVEKTVAEGAAAATLAAVLERRGEIGGKRIALVVSGGNIDVNVVSKVIERGLARDGRRLRLTLTMPDTPGSLARVAGTIAETRANILEVQHERAFSAAPIGGTTLALVVETHGRDHAQEIIGRLEDEGYRPEVDA